MSTNLHGSRSAIRAFRGKRTTFNRRAQPTRDDSPTHRLTTTPCWSYVANRSDVLDRVLTEFPPRVKYFANRTINSILINATDAWAASACSHQYLSERGARSISLQFVLQCR